MTVATHECDVLVIGSGAAGFAAAITARKAGLDVVLTEKAPVFGGTTATSGGYIWVPCNHLMAAQGLADDLDAARCYLREELGDDYSAPFIDAYLREAPAMVRFFVEDVGIPFNVSHTMPDYHPQSPGSRLGRSLHIAPVDARVLGPNLHRLRPLPRELSLFGMGVSSGSDLGHFYRFGRSVKSTLRVCGLLAKYGWDKVRYGRAQTLVNGNALIARLAAALLDEHVPVWTFSPALELLMESDRVAGARIHRNGQLIDVRARRGVILASGGFAHDTARRSAVYSHPARCGEHVSLTAPGNVGDGACMAEQAGGFVDTRVASAGAWMPISKVPRPDGSWGGIIHSVNHGKPGMIAVLRNGRRFADESVSYHDFVDQLIKHPEAGRPAGAFLICDAEAFSKYGLGYAKPFLPQRKLLQSGYLLRASSIGELARQTGMDPATLETTVTTYNTHAREGQDPEFGKGQNRYGHYLGDAGNPYNPNVAPLEKAPFYAVWMYAGDIGNFAGIRTNEKAQVIRPDGTAVPGLFAAGNDMASVFRGHYPGGGSLIGPAMTFGFIAARALADA